MNTKIKKSLSFLLLLIILFTNISPVLAINFENGQVITLEKDHDCTSLLKFKGQDLLKGVAYVVYRDKQTGKKQPAFCVEPNQEGIGTGAGNEYDVTLSLMKEQSLWRVLYKGYMGSTYLDWNMACDDDLYYATKTAVHCLVDGTTPTGKYEVPNRVGWGENISLAEVQERGAKVLEVAQQLYDYGINGVENYMEPEIYANKTGYATEKIINGIKYLTQKYTLTGNRTIESYKVSISNFPTGTKIFNDSNLETNLMTNNTFTIAIPSSNIVENITGNINITEAKIKTYPVFFAKAYDEELQDYIIYADATEKTSTSTTQEVNAYRASLIIRKIDANTSRPIAGVKFNVKYADTNENIGNFTTDSSGLILVNNLRKSKIIVTEISTLDQYALDTTPIEVELEYYNQTKQINVPNYLKKGNLKIIKVDKDNNQIKIPNVEFELLDSNNNTVGTYTTDQNGEIYIEGLKTGTYIIKETKANSAYYQLSQDITVEVEFNKTTQTQLENEKIKGQIKVIKVDQDYNEIKLENAEFQIIDSNDNVVETIKTDANGQATTSRLPIGTYRIKEISTGNDNYILNEQNQKVTVTKDSITEVTLENIHKTGNVKVFKVDKDNNKIALGNVEFDLFSEEFNKVIGTYITDVNGEIYIENLRIGDYKLIEKTTNQWYDLSENTEIKIEWDTTINTIIENELKKGQIKVIKVDQENPEIKIPGVKFEVIDEAGNVLETITTDENGEAITQRYSVRDYEKLTFREIETNEYYVLNEQEETVTLEANQIKTVVFKNEKKKGQIQVIKVDSNYNEIKLADVQFEIIDSLGNVVEKIKTDENGEAITSRLPIGEYKIKEVSTGNDNYILDEQNKQVIILPDTINEVLIENMHKTGNLKIFKVDKDNNRITLEGIDFDLYSMEFNEVIGTYTTDENGEINIENIRTGEYKLIEKATNKWYDISEDTEIKVEWDTTINTIIENELKKGQIKVIKIDKENPKIKISGVKFEVIDEAGNVLETITTDENGEAITQKYSVRDYKKLILKEIETTEDYVLNNEPQIITLEAHQIKTVTFENEPLNIKVNVEKTGFIEADSGQNIYYDFQDIQNNSNVALDSFTWADYLPTEAVRADKIYTGTWNEDLKYSIWYKTNINDFKILAEELSTQTNNEISFKSIELEEDEYITDFEFRFGTVNPGFTEIEKPRLYCDVLDNLENGFIFTNNTKVTGNYKDKLSEDEDNWTTLIYNKEPELEELPRTGF